MSRDVFFDRHTHTCAQRRSVCVRVCVCVCVRTRVCVYVCSCLLIGFKLNNMNVITVYFLSSCIAICLSFPSLKSACVYYSSLAKRFHYWSALIPKHSLFVPPFSRLHITCMCPHCEHHLLGKWKNTASKQLRGASLFFTSRYPPLPSPSPLPFVLRRAPSVTVKCQWRVRAYLRRAVTIVKKLDFQTKNISLSSAYLFIPRFHDEFQADPKSANWFVTNCLKRSRSTTKTWGTLQNVSELPTKKIKTLANTLGLEKKSYLSNPTHRRVRDRP